MAKRLPTAEYLRECFDYDPLTGVLTWKTRPLHHFKHELAQRAWNARHAGKPTGCPAAHGHLQIAVNQRLFWAHRIIWCMVWGYWPKSLDHKDGDVANNRLANLREATMQQNMWNKRHQRTSKWPRGVTFRADTKRYSATLWPNRSLGCFDTPEEAHEAWCKAAREQRGEFFRSV